MMMESTSDSDKQESPLSEKTEGSPPELAGTNGDHRSITCEQNSQVLRKDVAGLQQEGQVSQQVEDLIQQNQQLHQELSQVSQLSLQLEEDKRTLLDTAISRTEEAQERALARSSLDQLRAQQSRTAEQNQDLRASVRQLRRERDALANQLGKLQLSGAEKGKERAARRCEGGGARARGSRLDCFVQSVEEDRDFYRQEAERLRRMLRPSRTANGPRGSRGHSPPRQPPTKGGTYDSELMRLLRERDDLQALLDKYERHLSEIQGNVKVLSADRDKTSVQYQKAQEEIAHLRREVMKSKSPRAQKSSMTAHSILKRVEAERDEATTDLKRMSTERDSLRERLKISQETAINERAHLEQRVEDLQSAIYTLEQEHRELKSKQAMMKDAMMDLEEEASSLGHKLATAEGDLTRSRKECSALRLANNQLDSALSDSQLRLTARFGELQTAQEKNKQLEERNDGLLQQVSGLRDEVSTLQSTVSELDQRRDDLQEALERESDLLASATTQLDEKERLIRGLKIRVEELEASAECLRDTVSGRERELASFRRKLGDAEEELVSLAKMKDGALRENSLLRDDLDKARLDHQALQLKLEDSSKEAESLQRRLGEYSTDVSRLEVLLSCKEKECAELQEAQRRALGEAQSWEERARLAEETLSELREELSDGESERRRLKDTLENQELRLQEALVSERSCNGQISQLNRSLLLAEDDLRQIQSERSSTLSDLEKTRELCVKLDSSKEVVLRELDVCRSEVELLRKQLTSERLSMKSLESMLQSTREKELHSALSSQEQHAEIQLLRDKLTVADSKASTQVRELAQTRARSEQLESDLDITKRQLCAERFERERAVQELRLQGLPPSLRSSSPPRRSLSPRRSWSPDRTFQSSPERLATESARDRSLVFRDPYS
ncbi:testis-specific gene 10 protein isoform X3 [Anguilla anguilla]|uniref:testis-specific gene 10 protein isoform X3 n=1 Tax=Anguilla anguilla TaxID=7936 RepID=UPI0015ACCA38|nr:testis-specific gene 10 protein isoform X3 [Anguilla anguilla]